MWLICVRRCILATALVPVSWAQVSQSLTVRRAVPNMMDSMQTTKAKFIKYAASLNIPEGGPNAVNDEEPTRGQEGSHVNMAAAGKDNTDENALRIDQGIENVNAKELEK